MMRFGAGKCLGLVVLLYCCGQLSLAGISFGEAIPFSDGFVNYRSAQPLNLVGNPCVDIKSPIAMQTSYRSLYGLKELTENRAGASIRVKSLLFGIYFSSFGQSGYCQESNIGFSVSARISSIRFGASVLFRRVSFSEFYQPVSLVTGAIGLLYSAGPIFLYSVSRNLNQPSFTEDSPRLKPEAECGASYISETGLDSQVKVLFLRHQRPTATIGQSYPIHQALDVNWQLVLSPVRLDAGMSLEKNHVKFGYRFSHHPILGSIHTVSISIFR